MRRALFGQGVAVLLEALIVQAGWSTVEEPVKVVAGPVQIFFLSTEEGALEALAGGLGMEGKDYFEELGRLSGLSALIDLDIHEISQDAEHDVSPFGWKK